jgi:hypothetical protein
MSLQTFLRSGSGLKTARLIQFIDQCDLDFAFSECRRSQYQARKQQPELGLIIHLIPLPFVPAPTSNYRKRR